MALTLTILAHDVRMRNAKDVTFALALRGAYDGGDGGDGADVVDAVSSEEDDGDGRADGCEMAQHGAAAAATTGGGLVCEEEAEKVAGDEASADRLKLG
ncbi:hypothetical protein FGB62_8g12 [Gracilaria domingensis]|nr:hypothetical protein FGB62_8g12 [Gracilaria domingensis]